MSAVGRYSPLSGYGKAAAAPCGGIDHDFDVAHPAKAAGASLAARTMFKSMYVKQLIK
jgi:hypothetical protein